eukprot:15081439-Alexandrium_andersonii.AAC.1
MPFGRPSEDLAWIPGLYASGDINNGLRQGSIEPTPAWTPVRTLARTPSRRSLCGKAGRSSGC